MKFSVVVPVYNVEKYLDECLESILSQVKSYNDVEILLIDDGSTDSSPQICDYYQNIYPNHVRAYHKKNEGLLLTRRYGFSKSLGEYIINCDSDDKLESMFFEYLRKVLNNNNNPDVIIFNTYLWDGNNKKPYYENVFTEELYSEISKRMVLSEYFRANTVISMWGKVFKRNCLNLSINYSDFYRKSFGEDTLQSAEIYTNAQTFVYLNKCLYNYRIIDGMTKKFNSTYFQEFITIQKIIKKYNQYWDLKNFDDLYTYKLFTVVGRSITQCIYQKKINLSEMFDYLKQIRNHPEVKLYLMNYKKIRKQLKIKYRCLINLLLMDYYLFIIILIVIKSRIRILNNHLKSSMSI